MDGIGALKKTLLSLSPEITKGEKILIVVDADKSYCERKDEVTTIINNKDIDLFILPDNKNSGDLESLLLSTIPENEIIKCFDIYTECLEENDIKTSSINDKAKLFAYTTLSFNKKPKDSFEHFDFNHPKIVILKNFMKEKYL